MTETIKFVPKQLNKQQVQRTKAEAVAVDEKRKPANFKPTKKQQTIPNKKKKQQQTILLRNVGRYYIVCNGHFLIKMHHSWIKDTAWDYFEEIAAGKSGYYNTNRVASRIEQILPDWVGSLCPHAGGLLDTIELIPAGHDIVRNSKDPLVKFIYRNVEYFVPKRQVDLVLQFYPKATAHIAPVIEGVDLMGNEVKHHCPVTFINNNFVVAFVMPLKRN